MRNQVGRLLATSVASFIGLAGCVPQQTTNTQDVVANAIDDDLNIVDAADDRADHLDQHAAELLDQANTSSGAAATALRQEADRDMQAAAQIRNAGQADGVQAEDGIEVNAGLLNNQ